ncbi:MAG TPA: HEAT repeat domain-containing protein [Planctomycetota bacterium]|nr:HEAT repeat domain-containing protein [Planctomycetota bacterium]
MTKALLSVEDEQIRSNALHLLQGEPYETALPILAEHLRTDPSVAVREVAAQVLGELGDPRSVDWLLKAYQSDTLEIQVKAAVALLGLGHPESAVELVPRLAAGLDHPDGAVRQKTTQQLGSLVVRATIPYLARALQDSSGDVRIWAIQGLHAFYTPDILPLIAPLAQDPVQDVAETARDVIRSVGKGEGK